MNKLYKIAYGIKLRYGILLTILSMTSTVFGQTFEIWNWNDLSQVESLAKAGTYTDFVLMQNIGSDNTNSEYDAAHGWGYVGYETALSWNTTTGWTPIGSVSANAFTRTFDGSNKTISGLWINKSTINYQGLFGYVSAGAQIKNLSLSLGNPNDGTKQGIIGQDAVGGLVAYNNGGIISNINILGGIVSGRGSSSETSTLGVGGVVGIMITSATGSLTNVANAASITATSYTAGGIVGYMNAGTISSAANTGVIAVGSNTAGGIVGFMNGGTLTGSFSNSANITRSTNTNSNGTHLGGIVGRMLSNATISANSGLNNSGAIQGRGHTGGIIGLVNTSANIIFDGSATPVAGTVNFKFTGSVENIGNNGTYFGNVFGQLDAANVTLQNYTNTLSINVNGSYVGGVVGACSNGILGNNLVNNAAINATGATGYVGGIAGSISGSASIMAGSLLNRAVITSAANYVGGIFGIVSGGTINVSGNCINEGAINGINYVGGVIGGISGTSSVTVNSFINRSVITGGSSGSGAGGIVGFISNGTISGTMLNESGTDFSVTGNYNIGGIFGYISGGTVSCDATNNARVYSTLTSDGTTSYGGAGGVVGFLSGGTITLGKTWTNTGTISGNTNTGGIAGLILTGQTDLIMDGSGVVSASWLKVVNTASISTNGATNRNGFGGVVGYFYPNNAGVIIQNYTNSVTIIGANYTGGIVGRHGRNGLIQNCVNNASVSTVASTNDYVGGIVGGTDAGGNLAGILTNSGAISGRNNVGGIAGSVYNATFNMNPLNTGLLTSTGNYMGGLFGSVISGGMVTFTQSYENNAALNGVSYVGGIAGNLSGTVSVTGTLTNKAVITGTSSYIGGLFGYVSSGVLNVSGSCINEATVNGVSYIGGIVGYIAGTSSSITSSLINRAAIVGTAGVGGIIGTVASGSISGTLVNESGTDISVTGSTNVGGIFGGISGGTISCDATNNARVYSTSTSDGGTSIGGAGGVVGFLSGGTITLGKTWTNTGAISGNTNTGGIAGLMYTGQTDLIMDGSGVVSASWLKIVNTAPISTNGATNRNGFGGVVGYFYPSNAGVIIQNYTNSVTITGANYTGGIAGRHGRNGLIQNCVNNTSVSTVASTNDYVGGIVGGTDAGGSLAGTLINSGVVSGRSIVGGIAGSVYNATFNINPLNTGLLTSTGSYVGGLFGSVISGGMVTFTQSYENNTALNGASYVGGIAGNLSGTVSVTGTLTNKAVITGTSSYIGGLFGYVSSGVLNVSGSCINEATVNGANYTGGIVGYITGTSSSITSSLINRAAIIGIAGVGGIIGIVSSGSISGTLVNESGTDISVTGSTNVGGIFGSISGGSVSCDATNNARVYSTSTSEGGTSNGGAGGVVGFLSGGTITLGKTWTNTGAISGNSNTGGIAGLILTGQADLVFDGSEAVNSSWLKIVNTAPISTNGATNRNGFGGVVGYFYPNNAGVIIQNYINSVTIIGAGYTGGIVGRYGRNGTIQNCTNNAAVRGAATNDYVGGIAGGIDAGAVLSGAFTNKGAISGRNYVGGIIGYIADGYLSGVFLNDSSVSYSVSGSYNIGGIFGSISGGIISCDLINRASVISSYATSSTVNAGAGGIVGLLSGGTVMLGKTWINIGSINGGCNTGGIVGLVTTAQSNLIMDGGGVVNASWLNISNIGNVSANSSSNQCFGGVVGYFYPNNAGVTIQNYINTASVIGANATGGIVGYHSRNGVIQNCANNASIGVIGQNDYVGGIVGQYEGGKLAGQLTNTAPITGYRYTGGIAGRIYQLANPLIIDGLSTAEDRVKIVSTGNVAGYSYAAGVVGYLASSNVTIQNYANEAKVNADVRSGGIVGALTAGNVIKSYNKADIISQNIDLGSNGGVIGYASAGTISDCYNIGNVTGSMVGGFIGVNNGATINASYNAGRSYGTNANGFVGTYTAGTFINCYFDQTTSGRISEGIPGITATATTLFAYAMPDGFDANWNSGLSGKKTYPYLTWQTEIGKSNEINYVSISPKADVPAAGNNVNITIENNSIAKRVFNPFGNNFVVLPPNTSNIATIVSAGTPVSVGVMSESDVVAFDIGDVYTVSYSLSSITGTGAGTVPVDGGAYVLGGTINLASGTNSITPPAGLVFAGWTTDQENMGTVYNAGSFYTIAASDVSPITFYAKWTPFKIMNDNAVVLTCVPNTMINMLSNDLFSGYSYDQVPIDTIIITTPSAMGAAAFVDFADRTIIYSYRNGFEGSDSLQYKVVSGGYADSAWINVLVVPCPDNIDTATCVGARETFEWAISSSFTSKETNVATYISPLAADLNGDSIPEILAAKWYCDYSFLGTPFRYFRDIYVYWGTDREHPTIIPTQYSWFVSFGFSAAKVKINDEYQSIVVMIADDGYLYAYTSDSTKHYRPGSPPDTLSVAEKAARIWRSEYPVRNYRDYDGFSIGFADFDNDGNAEVYAGNRIFDAATGKLLVDGPGYGNVGKVAHKSTVSSIISDYSYLPAVADMDGDGKLEFIAGTEVYTVNIVDHNDYTRNSMTLIVDVPPVDLGNGDIIKDGYTAIVDINQDGRLDVVVVTNFLTYPALMAWDVKTKTLIGKGVGPSNTDSYVGVPFIGNVDTNSALEILFVTGDNSQTESFVNSAVNGFRLGNNQNFDLVYRVQTSDRSGFTGITLFDFNNSGIAELVYRDETDLRIMHAVPAETQGEVGTFVNVQTFPCGSGTGYEYPIIADVNNDGSAEIVTVGGQISIPNHTSGGTLQIYGSGNQYAWSSARKVWNQYAYNVVNINEDLTVPQYRMDPSMAFLNGERPFNNFLQQQTLLNKYGDPLKIMPNVIWVEDPVVVYEGDSIVYTGTITNRGNAALRAPFYITVYKNDTALANIIAIDSVERNLMPNDTMSFIYTIPDISQYFPVNKIIISINDRGTGQYPYQEQCEATDRKEILLTIEAVDDTVIAYNCGSPTIIDVLANDNLDICTSESIAFVVITQPEYAGNISGLNSEYKLEYLPQQGYIGFDSLQYSIVCSGGEPDTAWVRINVQNCGFTLNGTVFPFVHWGDPDLDGLFNVSARLYKEDTNVTPQRMFNDIVQNKILPVHDTLARFYNGKGEFVLGVPKYPGEINSTDNPGEPIDWRKIGKSVGEVDNTLLEEGDTLKTAVGLYTFENVSAGNYILVLSRNGFLIRMGKITISQNGYLGHRELIPGDADGNQQITIVDVSITTAMASSLANPKYNPRYDYDGNLKVDVWDASIVKFCLNATTRLYRETFQWINGQ